MWRSAARIGAALLLAAAPSIVRAQAPAAAPSRQELNPAARARLPAPPVDLFSAPLPGPCPLAVNPAPLSVSSVRLNGLTAVKAEALLPAYARFLNRKGDAADLCKIRDAVGEALFERGVLARVEIPPQTILGGAVVLEVIEAHIVHVTVRGDPGPAGPAVERYAAKLRGMTPFDVNRAQRYILLASDLPGLKVQASVRPSSTGERGGVDLDLAVQRDPQELILNAQNLQSKATGRWGGLARADFNGWTAMGERTSLIAYHTLGREQWVAQGLEEARLNGEGLLARGSVAYGESHPGDVLKPLGLKSTSLVATAELAYPLVRTRRQNLTLAGGLELVDQKTDVAGAGRLIDDQLRIAYVRAEATRTAYVGVHPVVVSGQVELRQGLDALGASGKGERLLSRAEAKPEAWVVYAQANLLAVVAPRLIFHTQVDAQYSRRPLAAYEEYAAGDLTIGRGYDPAFVSGDSALAASFELRSGPFQPRAGVALSPYAFYDVAHVANRDRGGFTQTVNSVGVGVQVPLRDRWLLDVTYVCPLDRREPDGARPAPRILANLTARFF
jgi:hemolysin activation/secretion protein